jgi:hypothetical protein
VNHAGAHSGAPLRKRSRRPSQSARTPSNFSLTSHPRGDSPGGAWRASITPGADSPQARVGQATLAGKARKPRRCSAIRISGRLAKTQCRDRRRRAPSPGSGPSDGGAGAGVSAAAARGPAQRQTPSAAPASGPRPPRASGGMVAQDPTWRRRGP